MKKEKIAITSIFVNLVLALGKTFIGLLSGSSAILAEGVHSGMDVISSFISFLGIKASKKPVDKKHPYGHYKFEVLSGLIITIILFITGLGIIYQAYKGFLNPELIAISYLALGIMVLSAVLNEIMSRLKVYYGKKENSLSLLSDGVHDKIDVYSSIAILIGIFLMPFWIYVDSILALLIGLYILKESFELGKEATDSLLDISAGEEIEKEIENLIKKEGIELSDLKTQKKGSAITANIEIKVSKSLSVEKATEISNNLKEILIKKMESLEYVSIQIKSLDVTNSYFKPKDFVSKVTTHQVVGWQKKGRFKNEISKAQGKGPKGFCICPKCGFKTEHKNGMPCPKLKCPKCKISLRRE